MRKANPSSYTYRREVIKWTTIGFLIRVFLMPFTMHGQDLLFSNYFPLMFVKAGVWDPYGFISTNFPYFPYNYYGPVLFLFFSISNFLFVKLLNMQSLIKMLEISSSLFFKGFSTIDYVQLFSNLDMFKNLFLMKVPYLILDFIIGAILLKLVLRKQIASLSYKLWMLNIMVLHSVYMVGQSELVPTFFIIAALFAAMKERPYLSVICLSLGGATKLFPYVLILPSCLLLGCNWKKRFSLIFVSAIVSLLLYLPFYLSSGKSVFGVFMISKDAQYSGAGKWILLGIFIIFYFFICLNCLKESKLLMPQRKLLYYFTIILFLFYAIYSLRFRYFILITPLLALIIPENKKLGMFILFIISFLAFLCLGGRELQLGLFAPLNPDFLKFPAIHEIIGHYIDIKIIYKILARISVLSFFTAAWWVWRIKNNDKGIFLESTKTHSQ